MKGNHFVLVRLNKSGKEIKDRIFKPIQGKSWKDVKAEVYWNTEGDDSVNDKYNLYVDGKMTKVITTKEILKESENDLVESKYEGILTFEEFMQEKKSEKS